MHNPDSTGRYLLHSELGRGRRSIVLAGEDPLLGRPVALKRALAATDAPLLLEEARRLARIRSPHVVGLLDVVEGPPLTLVLQQLEGQALRARLAHDTRLPVAEVAVLAADLLDALSAVHAAGLVHGDVKPENLWVGHDGRLVLLDLGALGDVTPLYQAPETFAGPLSPAADLYAAGVVIFEMVAGRPPFDATDPVELAARKRSVAPPRAATFGAVVPDAIEAWLARALAAEPQQRWPAAGAARAAWDEALAQGSAASPRGDARCELHPAAAQHLDASLARLAAGTGSVQVLAGEAGAGKSTLVSAWIDAAHARRLHALHVQPAPDGRPFGAWEQALAALPGGMRRTLAALVPRSVTSARAAPRAALPHEATRIAQALRQRTRRTCWAIAFDDLQACDEATQQLALLLAAEAAHARLAVLLVVEDPAPAARALRARLAQPGWQRLDLEPPTAARWQRLIAAMLGTPLASEALCTHLWERTGGQPQLARLLLDALRADGTLRFDSETWIFRPAEVACEVPPAIRDWLTARLSRCDAAARELLTIAAVQGPVFDPELVALRCARTSVDIAQAFQDIASTDGWVRRAGATFRFHPPLLVDVLRRDMAPERQRDEHARLASALLQRDTPDDAAIGMHLAQAGMSTRALPYLERAAQRALAAADFAAALAHADAAAGALAGEPAEEAAARQHAQFRHLRGRALQGLAAWDAAADELQHAVVLARAWGLDEVEMRVLRTQGEIEYARGRFEASIEHFLEAQLAAARLGDQRELHELGLKIGNIYFERGELPAAYTEYTRALDFGTQSGDLELEARAANNVALVDSVQGRKERAVEYFGRSLERFRALGRDDAVAQLDQNIGQVYLELGNWAEARNSFARCMQQCERTGQDALLAVACLDAAEANLKLGALSQAAAAAERALSLARERDDAVGIANAMRVQASLAAADGDVVGAEAQLLEAIGRLERLGQPLHLGVCWKDLGAVRLRAGRPAAAAQALDAARKLFASLDAAQHASEVEVLRARCGEVESCNLP
jgi:eukaryotic-like serine/threonine-protein kinase